MAIFCKDTFTLSGGETAGESLAAHVGEIGAHWTSQSTAAGDLVVGANGQARLGPPNALAYWYGQYIASGSPASADYTVQADLILQSAPTVAYSWGVSGRVTAANTFYCLNYNSATGHYELSKQVGGVNTLLGSATAAFASGSTHTIQLVMSGTQLSGVVDGTTVIGPLSDSAISAAGKAGLNNFVADSSGAFTPADGTGPQFDNLLCTDTAPLITVDVSPPSAQVAPSAQQQFVATVSGSSNQNVTWSVQEGSSGGTISSVGLYTAPAGQGTYHVVATAAADGWTTGTATVVVYAPTPPGTPHITLATSLGRDTITLPAPSSLGSSAIAGYRLYAGTQSGFETYAGVFITPSSFPASFPTQPTAAAGGAKYYYVRTIDTADLLSAPSNECWSRTTGLVASGQLQARVFIAPYGAGCAGLAATLGYTVYDYAGALLVPHTSGQTTEIAAGSGTGTGIYAALISLDVAYSGVVVWDAPSGSGPYIEAFDPGALGQVTGYTTGANPATLLLQNPANKLLTNSAGQVQHDLSQAVPTSNTAQSVGDALNAARAQGFGKWTLVGAVLTLYAPDGTTAVRTFTLDNASAPTVRA